MVALDAGKLGWAPGAETGSRGGGRRLICKAHGREESQQRRKRAENWRTARLGVFVAVACRRPSSACALGESAAWRVREATGAARDGAQRESSAWPGNGTRPSALLGRAGTGEGRGKKRERERRELIDSKIKFFSRIPFETKKTLNTKVVENLKTYNFYFRKKFIRAKV